MTIPVAEGVQEQVSGFVQNTLYKTHVYVLSTGGCLGRKGSPHNDEDDDLMKGPAPSNLNLNV